MPWSDRYWSDNSWQDNWWSSGRGYRGTRAGNPWRASQVRRSWGQFNQGWGGDTATSSATTAPPTFPQLPPPPAQAEGHWEVSYKWVPAETAGDRPPAEPSTAPQTAEAETEQLRGKKESGKKSGKKRINPGAIGSQRKSSPSRFRSLHATRQIDWSRRSPTARLRRGGVEILLAKKSHPGREPHLHAPLTGRSHSFVALVTSR